jgi:hypothetical protein
MKDDLGVASEPVSNARQEAQAWTRQHDRLHMWEARSRQLADVSR